MTHEHVEMHLKFLFDLDNLLADMEAPEYKDIGFTIEKEQRLSLTKTRNELLKKLPAELAEMYERLKQRYQRAIAPVDNGFCFGCFQKLPTEMISRQKELLTCPNCGRILYWRKKK